MSCPSAKRACLGDMDWIRVGEADSLSCTPAAMNKGKEHIMQTLILALLPSRAAWVYALSSRFERLTTQSPRHAAVAVILRRLADARNATLCP